MTDYQLMVLNSHCVCTLCIKVNAAKFLILRGFEILISLPYVCVCVCVRERNRNDRERAIQTCVTRIV